MRILLTGSSGLIGQEVQRSFRSEGVEVLALVRQKPRNEREIQWNPYDSKEVMPERLAPRIEDLTAVIHLAGENVGEGRWSAERKKKLLESRVVPTGNLARLLAGLERKPKVFISASAVGIYGSTDDGVKTEFSEAGEGFLAEICTQWERAATPAVEAGIRVVHPRFGVVLSPAGGALKTMLPVFKAGVGGRLGSGRQWMSWVTLPDVVRALRFLIESELQGAVNVCAPEPVTNAVFTKALGHVLHRPTVMAVPAFVLKAVFGEMAEETVLASQRAVPQRLADAGFHFESNEIEQGLRAVL